MTDILKEIYYNLNLLTIKASDAYLMSQILNNLEIVINNLEKYQNQNNEDKKE